MLEPEVLFTTEEKGEITKLSLVTLWISLFLMVYLTIALVYTLIQVCKNMNFRFLIRLIFLVLISDAATIFLSVGLWLETMEKTHIEYAAPLSIEIGITTFFFNFGNNNMHWFFGLKYWIIANEIPKLIEGNQVVFKEKTYTVFSIAGFIINTIPCILLGIWRG